jgi:excinuclease ABC subunit B
MREAAGNLEFEEAGRMRDEIKRLQSVALAVRDDPMGITGITVTLELR